MVNSKGLRIEITIRDEAWKRLDSFKCSGAEFHKIAMTLLKKYGIHAIKQKPKDMEWLGKADW